MQKKTSNGGLFRFFTTYQGRKLVFIAAGVTTGGLFLANFVPHTFGLNYYKSFVQSYKNGMERPVSPQVLARVDKALDRLQVDEFTRKFVKPFTVFGFDIFQAGTTNYRNGAALGIPVNYEYASTKEINRSEIRFRDQQIDWNSESGKLLEEAIVLTEEEQIFGLCKAILQLQTQRVLLNSAFPTISFLMVYTLGQYTNLRMNLYERHISVRLVLYTILGLFGLGCWSFMKDFNQVSYDAEIDKQLSMLGPEFVAAGLRYYDKQLKKNKALRCLLGDNTYTALGNENYMFRQKSMPLTARKSFFEEKLQQLNMQNAGSAEVTH